MPLGRKNVPSIFQRAMEVLLSSVKWQFTLAYLHYIVIFFEDLQGTFRPSTDNIRIAFECRRIIDTKSLLPFRGLHALSMTRNPTKTIGDFGQSDGRDRWTPTPSEIYGTKGLSRSL